MTNPFDNLIVRLSPDQRNQKWIDKQVYSYDTKTAVATLYTPGLFKSFIGGGSNVWYYRVSEKESVTCPPIEVTVQDSTRQKHIIEVVVIIKKITQNRTPVFISALARRGLPPFDALVNYLAEWIQDFVNQKQTAQIDILTRFSPEMEDSAKSRKECIDYCINKAEMLLGLDLTCEIRLPEADLVIEPISLQFGVYTKDCEEELTTHIDLNIIPPDDDVGRNLALQKILPMERIHGALKLLVSQWFRNHCTLEQFCYKPAEVRAELEKVVQAYVKEKLARILFSFRVSCTAPFPKEFPIREDYEVTCEIEPGPTQIQVRHRVLLERQDIAKFRSSSIIKLEEWMENLLERYTRAVLFGKKYVDIILDFDSIQKEIKGRVSAEVERIGFKVMHLVTIPTDEQMRSCLDGVLSFETETLSLKTKDSRVEFKLSAAAQVKLEDLEKVRSFLRPGDFLREQFRQSVNEEVAQIVRKFAPECLYLYFRDGKNDGGIDCVYQADDAPENQIKHAVTTRFLKEFGATVDYLTLNEEPTELTKLFSAIRPPRNQRIEVIIEPRGDMGTRLMFHFDYRIVAIAPDGWTEFQELAQNSVKPGIMEKAKDIHEAITDMLSRSAREQLETLPLEILCHPAPSAKNFLKKTALENAIGYVKDHFGFIIEILNFTRELSDWEVKARQKTKEQFDYTHSRVESLRERLAQLEDELGPNDPGVQDLKDEIAKHEQNLKKFDIGQNEYFKGALTAISSPSWNRLLLEEKKKDKGDGAQSADQSDQDESDPIDVGDVS